jgi:hypothetical protein
VKDIKRIGILKKILKRLIKRISGKNVAYGDGYFNDDGMGDILFVQEEPNNEEAECNLCGKTEDIVQMKGTGQFLCGNACDEDEDEDAD